jgi:hypothetical protein
MARERLAASADFEDEIVGLELEEVRHHRDHERLRDCLCRSRSAMAC